MHRIGSIVRRIQVQHRHTLVDLDHTRGATMRSGGALCDTPPGGRTGARPDPRAHA